MIRALAGLSLGVAIALLTANPAAAVCNEQSSADRADCLRGALADADGQLFEALQKLLKSIDKRPIPASGRDEWKGAAVKSHYLWLGYRDAQCDVVMYEWWGGNGALNAVTECLVLLTREQADRIARSAD